MAYVKQIWEDGVTPCDAEHMNHIEDGIYDTLNEIINTMCPVGTYYETSDLNFNPNIVWSGTWELDEDGLGTTQIDYTGEGQSHNNVQPSKVINRWHRTA